MYIVFEGLDGSGKTEQASALAKSLGAVYTMRPSDGHTGQLLRRVLHGEVTTDNRTLMHLFAADAFDHDRFVRQWVQHGFDIVSDRSHISSLAYQGAPASLYEGITKPDLVFFLRISPEAAAYRLTQRGGRDLYDDLEKQQEVAEQYEKVLRTFDNVIVIDADRPADKIKREILFEALTYT